MSTPTDPYNSAENRPFSDDDGLLAPIPEETETGSANADPAAEGDFPLPEADPLVWDRVFTAESAASAEEPAEEGIGGRYLVNPAENGETRAAAETDTFGTLPPVPSVPHEQAVSPVPPEASVSAEPPAPQHSFSAPEPIPAPAPQATAPFAPAPTFTPAEENTQSAKEHSGEDTYLSLTEEHSLPEEHGLFSARPTEAAPAPQATAPFAPAPTFTPAEIPSEDADPNRANATLGDIVGTYTAPAAGGESPADGFSAQPVSDPYSAPAHSDMNVPAEPQEPVSPFAVPPTPGFADTFGVNAPSAAEGSAPQATEDAAEDIEPLPARPKGRGAAHTGIFFLTLILIPVAWYLISDAGIRLSLVENNPWETGSVKITYLLELVAGIIVAGFVIFNARISTLGGQLWGAVLGIAGLVALFIPKTAKHLIDGLDRAIGSHSAFTANIVHHLNLDLGSGRIAVFGFAVFIAAFAAHCARRRGAERAQAVTKREFLLASYDSENTK